MQRIASLDGLRALAAVAVIFFHAGEDTPLSGGFLGVDVFFVLSGYLITSILLRERSFTGRIDTLRFYGRRFVRLMPALVFLLAVYVIAAPLMWPSMSRSEHIGHALVAGFYLSDYGYALWRIPEFLRHTWSLSVEEHFYLLWPPVLVLLLRSANLARALALSFAILAIWRGVNFSADWQFAYYRFDTRIAGIILGAWLAAGIAQRRELGLPSLPSLPCSTCYPSFLGLSVALYGAEWGDRDSIQYYILLAEFATLGIVVSAVAAQEKREDQQPRLTRFLAHPIMVRMGVLSYGIYLWHFPISLITRDAMDFWPSFAICLFGATAMAWISYETVERPARLWRRRPARETEPAGSSGAVANP